MNEPTKVIFRKWPNGDIIAIFPEVAGDANGVYCRSYEQIGQHGAVDAQGLVSSRTAPAKPDEYADLKAELEIIGYTLAIISRIPPRAFEKRLADIAKMTPVVICTHPSRFS